MGPDLSAGWLASGRAGAGVNSPSRKAAVGGKDQTISTLNSDQEGSSSSLPELIDSRRDKAEALREAGVEPYPHVWESTHTLDELRRQWGELPPDTRTGDEVAVAGRLVALRDLGGVVFGVLVENGVQAQLLVPTDAVDPELVSMLREAVDIGDWLGVAGEVVTSQRGELSVLPDTCRMLAKALRPLPDQWGGLADVEQRYRQRELDLIANLESRQVFEIRHQVLQTVREELVSRGFVEVETPMLHPIPGGAAARPFVTHHNALDVDLFLRIAPELYLKRLIIGGMDRVFELNRSFRNEGMSSWHNPEFTMLEAYEAYADYKAGMRLAETLVRLAAERACKTTDLVYDGRPLQLGQPFQRRPMLELVRKAIDQPALTFDSPRKELVATASQAGVAVEPGWGPGRLIAELYEQLVEPTLWAPTFVTEHPIETSPLAKPHRERSQVTERFELIIAGREVANGFSEMTDPNRQRERFEAQAASRAAGDEEAMPIDEAYLRALEYGLPPTSGLGVGIDRLVMLLADAPSIRDVILFPTLRPEQPQEPR